MSHIYESRTKIVFQEEKVIWVNELDQLNNCFFLIFLRSSIL